MPPQTIPTLPRRAAHYPPSNPQSPIPNPSSSPNPESRTTMIVSREKDSNAHSRETPAGISDNPPSVPSEPLRASVVHYLRPPSFIVTESRITNPEPPMIVSLKKKLTPEPVPAQGHSFEREPMPNLPIYHPTNSPIYHSSRLPIRRLKASYPRLS